MNQRAISKVAPNWWDYTTLDSQILSDAASLTIFDFQNLARPGFEIFIYDTLEEFYLAQALEYIEAWKQSTPTRPAGICGPIGPTEQLPLVAMLVNSLGMNLAKLDAHFWGMDEWIGADGAPVSPEHPLSFARADRELCFDRIFKELRIPDANLHFPTGDLSLYQRSFDQVRCVVMQGGQGDIKHWAFNDPPRREGRYRDLPPTPDEYRKLSTRIVDLHPMTIIQNARTSAGGRVTDIPTKAVTVGPLETWKAERVSIWQAGQHDNPFGMRLTAMMISRHIEDSSVPMSLLAGHPNVRFSYFRPAITATESGMH